MQASLRGIEGAAARGPKSQEGHGLSLRADARKQGLKYGMQRCKRRYRIILGGPKKGGEGLPCVVIVALTHIFRNHLSSNNAILALIEREF